jgi:hypothetical protein
LQGVPNGKNLPPVDILGWAGPISQQFAVDWLYMDWQVAKGGGVIRVDNNTVVITLPAHHMESRKHREDEFFSVRTPAVREVNQIIHK